MIAEASLADARKLLRSGLRLGERSHSQVRLNQRDDPVCDRFENHLIDDAFIDQRVILGEALVRTKGAGYPEPLLLGISAFVRFDVLP